MYNVHWLCWRCCCALSLFSFFGSDCIISFFDSLIVLQAMKWDWFSVFITGNLLLSYNRIFRTHIFCLAVMVVMMQTWAKPYKTIRTRQSKSIYLTANIIVSHTIYLYILTYWPLPVHTFCLLEIWNGKLFFGIINASKTAACEINSLEPSVVSYSSLSSASLLF